MLVSIRRFPDLVSLNCEGEFVSVAFLLVCSVEDNNRSDWEFAVNSVGIYTKIIWDDAIVTEENVVVVVLHDACCCCCCCSFCV